MNERPILFSGAMARAILDGQKTQTRRVVKPQPYPDGEARMTYPGTCGFTAGPVYGVDCPYGQPGDRLWVRETWRTAASLDALSPAGIAAKALDANYTAPWAPIQYEADSHVRNWDTIWGQAGKTRVSIHMPRWASRLTLEVMEVRVQRLQEISEEDARAEGAEPVVHEHWTAYDPATEGYPSFGVEPDAEMIARKRLENVRYHGPKILSTARQQFERLWQAINGERPGCSWTDNPWVWCVSFRRAS